MKQTRKQSLCKEHGHFKSECYRYQHQHHHRHVHHHIHHHYHHDILPGYVYDLAGYHKPQYTFPTKSYDLTAVPPSSTTILQKLSEDLLVELLRSTDACGLYRVSLVCKKLNRLVCNPYIWRLLVEKTFGIKHVQVPRDFDWKLYFREKQAFRTPLNWIPLSSTNEEQEDSVVLPTARQSHGAARAGNNIVIVGGHQVVGETFMRLSDIWAYNTDTKEWKEIIPTGKTAVPVLSRHRLVSINEKVYSFGGILQSKQKLNSVFKFDLEHSTWEEVPASGALPEPRCDSVVVNYKNYLVVFGGSVQDLIFPSDIHLFNTDTGIWTKPNVTGPIPSTRIGCTGVVIDDNMYIYGGGDYDKEKRKYTTHFTEVWRFDFRTFEWTFLPSTGDLPQVTDFLNAFVVGHHIIIEGGWCSEPYAFNIIDHTWTALHSHNHTPKVNNNDSSVTLVGDAAYYYGGYYNGYLHHLYKLDLSHLSFLRK